MESSWFDLLPRISGGVFALGAIVFVVSLILLRIGRKGGTWRLRRAASKRGGNLLIFSFGLWMIALVLTGFTLVGSAIGSRPRDLTTDDLYGVVLLTSTPSPPTATPTPTPTLHIKATPTLDELIR
jgi:hypothetical protein